MKDFINYYYHFYVSVILFVVGKYFFSFTYVIYEINEQLNYSNRYYHKIISNKDNRLITMFENKPFVMLKLSSINNMPITIFDIKGVDFIKLNKTSEKLIRFNWPILWQKKVDYFESQIMEKKDDYAQFLDSFYYYTGMAENAIMYVNEALLNEKEEYLDELVVSHKRFYKDMSLLDFYDPTTLIIDHRSRDVAEFLKCSFLTNDYDFGVIRDYLDHYKLSTLGAHLLFGRLLFPGFYFDHLEKCLFEGCTDPIYWLEDRIDEYNMFLAEIFEILIKRFELQEVKWIIKKM